jgi:hypothetical protein
VETWKFVALIIDLDKPIPEKRRLVQPVPVDEVYAGSAATSRANEVELAEARTVLPAL